MCRQGSLDSSVSTVVVKLGEGVQCARRILRIGVAQQQFDDERHATTGDIDQRQGRGDSERMPSKPFMKLSSALLPPSKSRESSPSCANGMRPRQQRCSAMTRKQFITWSSSRQAVTDFRCSINRTSAWEARSATAMHPQACFADANPDVVDLFVQLTRLLQSHSGKLRERVTLSSIREIPVNQEHTQMFTELWIEKAGEEVRVDIG